MLKKLMLCFLLAFISLSCIPTNETSVVFDEMWDSRWSTDPGKEYNKFKTILEDAGHPVIVWKGDPIANAQRYLNLIDNIDDVDILIIAMPQVVVEHFFIEKWIKEWVEEGGVLFVITDHANFPQYANPLLADYGLEVANITPVVGDGVSHCPPGSPFCLKGSISFRREHGDFPILFDMTEGMTHVTTKAGSVVRILDSNMPITNLLTLWSPVGFHPQMNESNILDGKPTFVIAHYAEGAVVVAAEAAMFGCGGSISLGGMCAADSQWNDEWIVNLFWWLGGFR